MSWNFLLLAVIGTFKLKWRIAISSSYRHGWKKACLMFENGISTLTPFEEAYLTPFEWISRFPIVFLPSIAGLITTFSRMSLRP